MSADLFCEPWFLHLGERTRGTGWTAHEAARSYVAARGLPVLPPCAVELVLSAVPRSLRDQAVATLLALRIWIKTPAGIELHNEPSAGAQAALMMAADKEVSPVALRKRVSRQGIAARKAAAAAPVTAPVTPPVTPGVTGLVTDAVTSTVTAPPVATEPAPIEPETPGIGEVLGAVTSGVTDPVTSLVTQVLARASQENSLSSPSSLFQGNFTKEREREEKSPREPASETTAPEAVTEAVTAASKPPSASMPGPAVAVVDEMMPLRVAQVVSAWARILGKPAACLAPKLDHKAIEQRLGSGATQQQFEVVFGVVKTGTWFHEPDPVPRWLPRFLCRDVFDTILEEQRQLSELRAHEEQHELRGKGLARTKAGPRLPAVPEKLEARYQRSHFPDHSVDETVEWAGWAWSFEKDFWRQVVKLRQQGAA